MPAFTSIVLTDAETTPVNHTLVPKTKVPVATVAQADSTGAAITEKRLTVGRRVSGERVRTTIKLRIPTVFTETVNGVAWPKVAREGFVDCTFNLSKDHTVQERKNIVAMFASALASGKVLTFDTITKDEDVW